jgi:hypothetical protein
LYRKFGDGLYFYNKNIEVDFFVAEQKYAVQVSYSIADEETRNREVRALEKLNALLPLQKSVIVTYEEEEIITFPGGQVIEVIPAWTWLLE